MKRLAEKLHWPSFLLGGLFYGVGSITAQTILYLVLR